jgi:hypothetical protein
MFIATNKEIINAAREGWRATEVLVTKLQAEQRQLNGVNIATVLLHAARAPQILTQPILKYLAEAMQESELGAQGIGNALYGLQGVKDSNGSRALIEVIVQKVKECKEEFKSQHLGNSLYGMQSQKDSPEVRELLRALESKIRMCTDPLSSQTVGNSMYGLHSLGDSGEVRRIVKAIAEKVEQLAKLDKTKEAVNKLPRFTDAQAGGGLHATLQGKVPQGIHRLDGQAIGNAVYGIQSIGDAAEVQQLLEALVFHLDRVRNPLTAQEVRNALYGLKSQFGSTLGVRRFCSSMAVQMKRCVDEFRPQDIANALVGLRWLGDSKEVQSVLSELVVKACECSEPFDAHAIGDSLYGLQSPGKSSEMRHMLAVLRSKVDQCWKDLNPQEIGHAADGLQTAQYCANLQETMMKQLPDADELNDEDRVHTQMLLMA